MEKESTSILAADSIRGQTLQVSLLTACANAAYMAATEASFAEERLKDFLSVSQQRESAHGTVKSYCAQAARETFKLKHNMKGKLKTENTKKKRKNKMVVKTPIPLVQSTRSQLGDSMRAFLLRFKAGEDSDSLMVLAEEASRTSLEMDLPTFSAKLDNPLTGSARPLPLCGLMASSTGK
jgi:hypothetical protein